MAAASGGGGDGGPVFIPRYVVNEGDITAADMRKDLSAVGPNNANHPEIRKILKGLTTAVDVDTDHKKLIGNYVVAVCKPSDLQKESLPVYKQGKQPDSNYKKLDDQFPGKRVIVTHDAGISPEFLINTPPAKRMQLGAHMFDEGPGGKGWKGGFRTFPGIGQTIHFGPEIMRVFGFKNLDVRISLASELVVWATGSRDEQVYTLTITHTPEGGRSPWNIVRKRTIENYIVPVADREVDYFAGNNVKNTQINDLLSSRFANVAEEIEKWLVAKALGDLIQVLLLLKFIMELPAAAATIGLGFSCDSVYSSRLINFLKDNTGCVYQSPGKIDGIVSCTLYYLGIQTEAEKSLRIFTAYKKQVLEHNALMLQLIDSILATDTINAGGSVVLTEQRKQLFRSIGRAIVDANGRIDSINHVYEENEASMKSITEHKAIQLFMYEKTGTTYKVKKVLPKMFRLFITGSASAIDPIANSKLDLMTLISRNNLDSILSATKNLSKMVGGAGEVDSVTSDIYNYTIRDTQYDDITKDDKEKKFVNIIDNDVRDRLRDLMMPSRIETITDDVSQNLTFDTNDLIESVMSQLEPYFNHYNIAITDSSKLYSILRASRGIPSLLHLEDFALFEKEDGLAEDGRGLIEIANQEVSYAISTRIKKNAEDIHKARMKRLTEKRLLPNSNMRIMDKMVKDPRQKRRADGGAGGWAAGGTVTMDEDADLRPSITPNTWRLGGFGGGARRRRSIKNKHRNKKTRKANNRKYNRRTHRRS